MHTPTSSFRRAFTLVELLISLGIALLLIYGINLVFRAVTDTVRVGNALAVATRKMRSVDSALALDFEGTQRELNPNGLASALTKGDTDQRWSGIVPIVSDINPGDIVVPPEQQPKQPAITIFCKRTFAFMSKADRDRGPNAAAPEFLDEDDNGNVTDFSQNAEAARLNSRVHRTDTIGFFTGGSYIPRSIRPNYTEGSGVAPQAWVWYGHALQHSSAGDLQSKSSADLLNVLKPFPTGAFVQPGAGDPESPAGGQPLNQRNFYASDWVLGRMAMTLVTREQSTPQYPGMPALGLPNAQYINQVFAEAGGAAATASPTLIDFNAQERRVRYSTVNPADSSKFDTTPATANTSMPDDIIAPSPVPFTSGLNDMAAVWPGLTAALPMLLPSGDIGQLTPNTPTGNFTPANFRGLILRYQQAQTNADWWKRSMVQGGVTASAAPYVPMRFNTVSAFSRPLSTEGGLNAGNKSALQATYLAKGCTQFIVEFAGDFVTQNVGTGAVTGAGPDGVIDFVRNAAGGNETQWYGLPRDVDGDGVADVKTVAAVAGATQSFEKFVDATSYCVAFGPNEFYPAGQNPQNTNGGAKILRPWLIRLTVNLNDASQNLGSGLQREFVFKVR